jgi:flagella basal body P-ring formation protein FlgA
MLAPLVLAAALSGPVPDAIVRSVQERMGDVRVEVSEIKGARVRGDEGARVRAVPEAGSRLGRAIRFVLYEDGVRTGSVVATIDVWGAAVRASQALPRGTTIDDASVAVVEAELTAMLLGRLPGLADIVGANTRRDIAVGEVLTDALVLARPTVRSGDEVAVTVTSGPVQVTGMGRASGSGRTGDLIRVLMPSSRTPRKARITGPGSVEIVR